MSEYTFLHHLQGTHTHTRTHRYSLFQASPSWILPKMPPRAAPLLLPCLILAGSRCDLQSQPLLGYPAVPRCRFFSCLADAKPQSALCAQWDPGNTAGPGLVKAASTPNTRRRAPVFSHTNGLAKWARSTSCLRVASLCQAGPRDLRCCAPESKDLNPESAELSESPEVPAMLMLTGCLSLSVRIARLKTTTFSAIIQLYLSAWYEIV